MILTYAKILQCEITYNERTQFKILFSKAITGIFLGIWTSNMSWDLVGNAHFQTPARVNESEIKGTRTNDYVLTSPPSDLMHSEVLKIRGLNPSQYGCML